MTIQEVYEILSGESNLIIYNNDNVPVCFETVFRADVYPYNYSALMVPQDTDTYGDDLICVTFLCDATKGFLDNDIYYPSFKSDSHTYFQLIALNYGWSNASNTGRTQYVKIITENENEMLTNANAEKNLTVYACHPDGTFSTVDITKINFVTIDDGLYYIGIYDENKFFSFAIYEESNDGYFFIDETSTDVQNLMIEKLMRTHIVGSKENFDILCNENKHYHMRVYKDDEMVEYRRLYGFVYNDEPLFYFSDVKTDMMWPFKVEKVLEQYRICRIDNDTERDDIFWNHPFHWRITNEHNLFYADECTFSRSVGNYNQTVYVVGRVVYQGLTYFALATEEEKNKNETDVTIYVLLRPRGEPWLYPVTDEKTLEAIIDKLNSD